MDVALVDEVIVRYQPTTFPGLFFNPNLIKVCRSCAVMLHLQILAEKGLFLETPHTNASD